MNIIIGIIKVMFLLGFLIFIHEGGHFIVAKLCKVKVKEFSIGFGPKLYSKKGIETKYSIRAIPLGGYVDMLGENEEIDEKDSFSSAKVSQRIAIVVAGAIVNIVFAIVVYFMLMSISGTNSTTIVKQIIPEYFSEQTTIEPNDKILKLNGKKVRTKADVDNMMYFSDGSEITLMIERNGNIQEIKTIPVAVQYGEMTRYILGIEVQKAESNLKNNIYYGFWETVGFVGSIFDSLKLLFTGNVGMDKMSGPIGISGMVVKSNGIYEFVYLLSIVSLSLGVTNLLPIPALDGGKLVFLLLEAIRGKKISEEVELQIQSIGFTFLILLSLYVSFNDVVRLF